MDERSWTVTGKAQLRFWGAQDKVAAAPDGVYGSASDVETLLLAATRRAQAAERDRDWWKVQHDTVMEDWRLDVAQIKADAAKAPAPQTFLFTAPPLETSPTDEGLDLLDGLLQFYDPQDGSITFQRDGPDSQRRLPARRLMG